VHVPKDEASPALLAARTFLEQRGSGARLHRNMLVFLAADQRRLVELEHGVADHLAWTDIRSRWEDLGLDAFGRNQAARRSEDAGRAVDLRIAETYHWALTPFQAEPTGPVLWDATKIDGTGTSDGASTLAVRTGRKLVNSGSLAVNHPPELVRSQLAGSLASLWAGGHVSVAELWEVYARYVYLPRLRSIDVLLRTAADGPASVSWEQHGFATADGWDDASGRYLGLVGGARPAAVSGVTLIVEPGRAAAQIRADAVVVADPPAGGAGVPPSTSPSSPGAGPSAPAESSGPTRQRRFYGVARLDPERYQRDFARLAAEVIANLAGELGTTVEITVDIKAVNDNGFGEGTIRTVGENARTLRMEDHGFEEQ
jgi:hypothetical protein